MAFLLSLTIENILIVLMYFARNIVTKIKMMIKVPVNFKSTFRRLFDSL